jgi:aminotransferase EvaB
VSRPVPFNDLGRGAAASRGDLLDAVTRVLDSGWYVLGPEHDAFEAELAAYLGAPAAVGVGNGTDALQLAMLALGVGAGDTVLTAANAGGYSSTAARSIGARPVYADVDPGTLLLTPATLDAAMRTLGATPAAVVVTHLYGMAADMPAIAEWAAAHRIPLIEDCAQSLGAIVAGRRAGTFGDAATISFYPTKNLGAIGDGGAVVTRESATADRVRALRQYGWESKYRVATPHGRNSRLDEIQAAVLRVRLRGLDDLNARRREIHTRYADALALPGVRFVHTASDAYVAHLAVLDADDRDGLRARLDALGIRTDVHYPIPDHRQPIAESDPAPTLPVTERSADRILSLPLFPELTEAEIARVESALAGDR